MIDYTGGGLTWIPADMHIAMFGRDAVVMSVPRDPAYPPRITGNTSAGQETLTPEHNTSISAVLTFLPERDRYVTCLWHNHFARCPIPEDCAAHFLNDQYRSGERNRPIDLYSWRRWMKFGRNCRSRQWSENLDRGHDQTSDTDVDGEHPFDELCFCGFDASFGFLPQRFDIGFGGKILLDQPWPADAQRSRLGAWACRRSPVHGLLHACRG